MHRHPTDCLLDPLVQTELPESVLFAGVLLGRLAGVTHFVDGNSNAQGRVCLFSGLWVCPIVTLVSTVDNGIEGVVDFPAFDDVLGFLVDLIADGLGIVARRSNKEVQRLHTGIAGALGHNIKQLPIWLCMQLIEHNTVGVKAMLIANISR